MVETSKAPLNRQRPLKRSDSKVDFADTPRSEFPKQPSSFRESLKDRDFFKERVAARVDFARLQRICLKLDQLNPFERVEQQFQDLGVTFKNAIALTPSNPAYPTRPGQTVLMGCPKSGWLEAKFDRPVRYVSGQITSSRRTVMAAFDANDCPIAQAESSGPNLATSASELSPNLELSLRGDEIRRVTFYAFDGQLTLSEFSFAV